MFKHILAFGLISIRFTLTSAQSTNHLPPCTQALQNRHFPSGFDCESYFTCFGGAYVLQVCPNLFWFQRTEEACAIINTVFDCEFAPTTVPTVPPTTAPPPTLPPTTTPPPTLPPTTTPAPVLPPHLPQCTDALQNRHFPSGFDCASYFTCFGGQFILQECPTNFWFQRTAESCALINVVHDCEFGPTTVPTLPPATTPPPTSPPATTPPTTSPPATTPPTTLAPTTVNPGFSDCPAAGVSKLVNPHSCTRFILCFDGVAVERSCSPGLYFSRSLLRCVRRAESDCLLDDNSCPADNDPENIVFIPDQEDCQRYFVCYDGAPVEFDCGDSLHFDPNMNWCIKEEDSFCEPSYPLPDVREIECPEDTENDIIFIPHPEECQFYFICLDGVSILARCARNLLFDYQMEKCFFADSAVCFNRNVPQLS